MYRAGWICSGASQSQSYFTTGGLSPIGSSWCQALETHLFYQLVPCGNSPYVTPSEEKVGLSLMNMFGHIACYWKFFLSCYLTSGQTNKKRLSFPYPRKCLLITCTPYPRKRFPKRGWFQRINLYGDVLADPYPSSVSIRHRILTVFQTLLISMSFFKFSKAANIFEISAGYSFFPGLN
jgi:hypothetical protein